MTKYLYVIFKVAYLCCNIVVIDKSVTVHSNIPIRIAIFYFAVWMCLRARARARYTYVNFM